MDEEAQILATIEDAESKVQTLKELIQDNSNDEQSSSSENRGSSEPAVVFSKDEFYYTRYMTLSTVKLFENRGNEVFRIPSSVGLFYICPNNPVRTAARSAVLRIVRIAEEFQDAFHPPAFVQVGDWVYPLMRGSMIYRSKDQYYLFPDLISTNPGSSVGVVLPQNTSAEVKNTFESLMLKYAELDGFPAEPPHEFGNSTHLIMSARTSVQIIRTNSGLFSKRASEGFRQNPKPDSSTPMSANNETFQGQGSGPGYGKRIGGGIKAGGELISRGLELGANGTARGLCIATTCLKNVLPKEEQNREIPSMVVDSVGYARETTGRVVELSANLLAQLAEITSNFAELTAGYIRAAATPLVVQLKDASGISQETIDMVAREAKDLGEGIVGGTADVYRGLENASRLLATALSNNTAEIVEHCCGPAAASVLQCAGSVVGNVALSGRNAGQVVNVTENVKRTAIKAGLAATSCD